MIPTDPTTWPTDARALLEAYGTGVATILAAELNGAKALPEPGSEWVTAMEAGWIENVLED